jgi:5'-nucleotidase
MDTTHTMRVLVSNDDGIDAAGLSALEKVARTLSSDVWTIAPDGDRSGYSHRITLRATYSLTKLSERRYSCSGSPVDCVLAAMTWLSKESGQPTFVLSGINNGYNVAEDVAYSGTLAIAREASFWNVPAIAVSRAKGGLPYRTSEVDWISALIGALWRNRSSWFAEGNWLSLNLPVNLPAQIRDADLGRDKIARQTRVVEASDESIVLETSSERLGTAMTGDDIWLVEAGFACVTRLHWYGRTTLPDGTLAGTSALASASDTKRVPDVHAADRTE